jgi:toxin-antitoxin system PIN domain toxin
VVLCDVGVLVSAGIAASPHHLSCRTALESLFRSGEPIGVSDLVLAAVVRVSTNQKIWQTPASVRSAFAFVSTIRTHPRAVAVSPQNRHWRIFEDLVVEADIRGSDTTDAYLAALAIEHGCDWWTTDAGFARFPGLRWRNLLVS